MLMRPSAVTHQTDTEQRRFVLGFEHDEARSELAIDLPGSGDGSLVPSGYDLVFCLDSAGVPSVGQWLRVKEPPARRGSRPAATGQRWVSAGPRGQAKGVELLDRQRRVTHAAGRFTGVHRHRHGARVRHVPGRPVVTTPAGFDTASRPPSIWRYFAGHRATGVCVIRRSRPSVGSVAGPRVLGDLRVKRAFPADTCGVSRELAAVARRGQWLHVVPEILVYKGLLRAEGRSSGTPWDGTAQDCWDDCWDSPPARRTATRRGPMTARLLISPRSRINQPGHKWASGSPPGSALLC